MPVPALMVWMSPGRDGSAVLLAITMFQLFLSGDGDNFHVFMRVGAEAFTWFYTVIVQYAQGAEIHAAGVVILVKTECMAAVEPVI